MYGQQAFAFIKRDFITTSSYRLSFLMQLFGIFFQVISFYFIARLVGDSPRPYLREYAGGYFSFLLIGIAFASYQGTGLSTFAGTIGSEQSLGTLEAMLVSPTPLSILIICASLWNFLFTSLNVLVYLIFGMTLFGVKLAASPNILGALIILILTILAFSGIGILSASFIVVLKRGDPVNWLFATLSGLVGTVYYPVAILPLWLRPFSRLVPITYSLEGIRYALLNGAGFGVLIRDISALAIFAAIFFPLGLICFKFAVRKAKIDGSLGHY